MLLAKIYEMARASVDALRGVAAISTEAARWRHSCVTVARAPA